MLLNVEGLIFKRVSLSLSFFFFLKMLSKLGQADTTFSTFLLVI